MTNETQTAQPTGLGKNWKTLQADLRGRGAGGDRHPFYPLAQLESGKTVRIKITAGPFLDAAEMHGQYSLVEMDVTVKGEPFRLCASGARLAMGLAVHEPVPGDELDLTPKGTGKNRTWDVIAI